MIPSAMNTSVFLSLDNPDPMVHAESTTWVLGELNDLSWHYTRVC